MFFYLYWYIGNFFQWYCSFLIDVNCCDPCWSFYWYSQSIYESFCYYYRLRSCVQHHICLFSKHFSCDEDSIFDFCFFLLFCFSTPDWFSGCIETFFFEAFTLCIFSKSQSITFSAYYMLM